MGIYIVLFIVFAETGLFAGFFLPGDSLLFLAGIYNRELIENVLFIESPFINVSTTVNHGWPSRDTREYWGYWFGSKVDITSIIKKIVLV
jgi:membrane-associated protein